MTKLLRASVSSVSRPGHFFKGLPHGPGYNCRASAALDKGKAAMSIRVKGRNKVKQSDLYSLYILTCGIRAAVIKCNRS